METNIPKNTKERILLAGADLIHLKGFNNTGLQEILNAAEVPKGSFYNYFKNKEDFGLQIIDFFILYFAEMAKGSLENPDLKPLERIEKMLDYFIDFFGETDYTRGCPIGNLSQELGDLNPAFRDRLKMAIDSMASKYARALVDAQIAGEIPTDLDVREAAYFIVAAWHGALVQMKILKNASPLENHKKYVFKYLLKPERQDHDH